MRGLGLFGLSIAEAYGGLGLTIAEEAYVAIEFGRTTPAFRSTFGTNVGIGSQGLVMAGTDAQKAAWLPRIARGEIITSFALNEPDVGSDSGAVQTRAGKDGDVYRRSGTKARKRGGEGKRGAGGVGISGRRRSKQTISMTHD